MGPDGTSVPGADLPARSGAGGSGATGEEDVIAHLAALFGAVPAPGDVGIGDDSAFVTVGGERVLFTSDLVADGVHFDLDSGGTLCDVGFTAITVNASDIAAMGGTPTAAVVSVAAPPELDLMDLFAGVSDAAAANSCFVVGGDLSQGNSLVVSVAMIGIVEDGRPVLRSGARPGDTIFVTGPLGASAASRNHRSVARVGEGNAARRSGATSMIDVSDGFALDLHRLAVASGVGVVVDAVPLAAGADEVMALGGGEDYELIFTSPAPDAVRRAFGNAGLRTPVTVGRCVPDPAVRAWSDGRDFEPVGWQHDVRWASSRQRATSCDSRSEGPGGKHQERDAES